MSEKLIFVAQEGRVSDLIGLKLLCASIASYEPTARIMLYVSQDIIDPLYRFIPMLSAQIEVIKFEGKDWTCKPVVLLDALRRKKQRVTWIDSDILFIGKASALYGIEKQTLIIAEESAPGAHRLVRERQSALGIPEGRSFHTTLSSAVLSVTDAHQQILETWSTLMTSDVFVSEQLLDKGHRSLFYGDQEVLEAVICSYGKFPIKILLNDLDLLQACWFDKIRKEKGRQPFATHATGNLKPWKYGSRLNQEIFPYFEAARTYRHLLTAHEQEIFTRHSPISTIIKFALGGFPTYRATRRLIYKMPGGKTLFRKLRVRKYKKIKPASPFG